MRIERHLWQTRRRHLDQTKRLLLGLSIELLIGAAVLFALIYGEGVRAGRDAQALLLEYEDAQQASVAVASTTSVSAHAPDQASVTSVGGQDAIVPLQIGGKDVIGTLQVGSIGLDLPVLSKTETDSLRLSVCYYVGAIPPNKGCMVITGHDYASGSHFGRLDQVKVGDAVTYTTTDGSIYAYKVDRIRTIRPDQPELVEEHEAEYALNLLTCTNNGNARLLVCCTGDTTP